MKFHHTLSSNSSRTGFILNGPGASQPGRRGMALVITLIMLSVTLVMALAFLALARRERAAVSTTTDSATARLAADSALAAAQAQMMANFISSPSGGLNYGLMVSTNFENIVGLYPGVASPTNVNYFYKFDNSAYTSGDFLRNVANLMILPRVPVFIQTNPAYPNNLDFRYYLDLNQNGHFDDTTIGGNVPDILFNGTTNGFGEQVTGDPQWVGILTRPDQTHSANNLFLSRYAFMAVPIGNGLDLNAIHNQSAGTALYNGKSPSGSSGYLRNEGVGSWEINLAAFLADLNTNQWDVPGSGNDYNYLEPSGSANTGTAFQDALSLLSYRYDYNLNTLLPLGNALAFGGLRAQNEPFDLNVSGPLLRQTQPYFYANTPSIRWAGSFNTNRFYDLPSELYNPSISSSNFVYNLIAANTQKGAINPSTYDRYTFYRMMSQMGTDSDPDDGKMNLNFRNIVNGRVVPGMETNMLYWTPLDFFTNAADRLVRTYSTNWFASNPNGYVQTYYGLYPPNTYYGQFYFYRDYYRNPDNVLITNDPSGFGLTNVSTSPWLGWTNTVPALSLTNIPVYVNGQFVYSPAVNRLLQLAANLFEASTNEFFPSVFRPLFHVDRDTNIFIVGFTQVPEINHANDLVQDLYDFSTPYDVSQDAGKLRSIYRNSTITNANIYGVPWIIGAKKGFPAFNQLAMLNAVSVTRKLQVGRNSVNSKTFYTNHWYQLSISNYLNASFWNSYSNDYVPQGKLSVYLADYISMGLSNTPSYPVQYFADSFIFNTNGAWQGSRWANTIGGLPNVNSFMTANWANTFSNWGTFFDDTAVYKTYAQQFVDLNSFDPWESNNVSCDPLPPMELMTTNWMRAIIMDEGHVIDYVQLRGPMDATNISAAIADPPGLYLWSTNNASNNPLNPSYGYLDQIAISKGSLPPPASSVWQPEGYPGALTSVQAGTEYFSAYFAPSHQMTYNELTYYATNNIIQAGYTATRNIFVPYLYQVNDPLVHYLANDLNAGAGAVWHQGLAEPNGFWQQANGVGTTAGGLVSSASGSFPMPIAPFGTDIVKGRYQPWGYAAPTALQSGLYYNFQNPFNAAYKDPAVWNPEYWDFPTNLYPTVGWIGRVHRGTPWQTVYLKATNIVVPGNLFGTNTWSAWTGDLNQYDAADSAPVQDRLLFDIFTARPGPNAALGTLSVNQTNLAAWSALLSGMVVLTNLNEYRNPIAPGNPIPVNTYTHNLIEPAGNAGAASLLGGLVAAINQQQTNFNPFVSTFPADHLVGAFEHAGDILATPALTQESPYINWGYNQPQAGGVNIEQSYGINDEEYEWLPQQMMGLVRDEPTPRYVIYAYGQALRPAPNGLVTAGGTYFGMVTNYQVVAESAVRAVISIQKHVDLSGRFPVTNYVSHVESYNVLPPE